MRKSLKPFQVYIILLVIACGGVVGLRWALARGIGLNPDSADYIDCAINLSRGQGYQTALHRYYRPIPVEDYVRQITSEAGLKRRPETYFPPLYSTLLACLVKTGLGAETAAAGMAYILFALNIFTVGFLVFRFSRGNAPFAVGAAFFMLASESILRVHTSVMTEPLFIFLCLSGLAILSMYLDRGRLGFLLGGAAVCGLAFLTRYTGSALIGTGFIGLCFFPRKKFLMRLPSALIFLALGLLPMAIFFPRNSLTIERAPLPPAVFSIAKASDLPEIRSTLSSWALPGSGRIELFSGQNALLSLAMAVALLVIMTGMIISARRDRKSPPAGGRQSGTPLFFALFIPVYLAVFLFADIFAHGLLVLDMRLLSPLFAPLLVTTAFVLGRWLAPQSNSGIRRIAAVVLAAYALVYAGCGIYWMSVCHRNGRGYNNRFYQASDVVEAMNTVRALDAIPIFTNDFGAIYFETDRYAYQYPSERGTRDPAALEKAIGAAPACFVYYWTPAHLAAEEKLPEGNRDRFEKSLIEGLGLRILARSPMITVLWRPARG